MSFLLEMVRLYNMIYLDWLELKLDLFFDYGLLVLRIKYY